MNILDLSYGLSLDAIHAILKKNDLVRQLRDCLFPSDQASKGVTASMVQDTVQSPQLGQVNVYAEILSYLSWFHNSY
jgi:hypothetical protein